MQIRPVVSKFLVLPILVMSLLVFFASSAFGNQCIEVFEATRAERTLENLNFTYPIAGSKIVPHILQNIAVKIEISKSLGLNPKSLAQLRKEILEARFILEVFGAAFPKRGERDPWLESWRALKQGYSLIGNYKSIPNSKPGKKEKAFDKVVEWIEIQLGGNLHRLAEELSAMAGSSVYLRTFPKGIQWDTALLRPTPHRSAESVFRELTLELLNQAKIESGALLRTQNFLDPVEAHSFHNFRKQLRAAYKMAKMLGIKVEAEHPRIKEILYDSGNINDRVESLTTALKKGEMTPEKAEAAQAKIEEKWEAFKSDYPVIVIQTAIQPLIVDLRN